MSVDDLYYIHVIGTSNGFVSVCNQIVWHLLLVISHNWLRLGIYLYVSFRISCYLYVDAGIQLLFAQTKNGQCMQYV